MSQFLGLVPIEDPLPIAVLAKSGNAPVNLDALPTYRVYGPQGVMQNGVGSMALKDSGSITGASNANPIVITSAGHGLTTGTQVTISGVLGNTAANGTWTVTVLDGNTFSLNGGSGNGNYSSGGTWNVTGLYGLSFTPSAANGFASGQTYAVLASGLISGSPWGDLSTFTVV